MLNSSLLHWFVSTPPAWLVACVIGLVPIELWAGVRRGRRPDPIETRTSITIGAVYFAVKIVAGHLVFFSAHDADRAVIRLLLVRPTAAGEPSPSR